MRMKSHLLNLATTWVWAAMLATAAYGQAPEPALAEAQQAALAVDILSADAERRERAVAVAEGLGPNRMSEEVRVALITLLTRLNAELVDSPRDGGGREQLVKGEFYLAVARNVAALQDPRAISPLTRVGFNGFSRAAARGLASFGEEALPAILEVVDSPGIPGDAVAYNLMALSMMLDGASANPISAGARAEIIRVARTSLRSEHGATLLFGTELAVVLKEPELRQAVEALSRDTSELSARGVDDATAQLVRKHALDTLAKDASRSSAQ